jgi:hypothetical protein
LRTLILNESIKTKAITSIDDGLVRAAAIIINKLCVHYLFIYLFISNTKFKFQTTKQILNY